MLNELEYFVKINLDFKNFEYFLIKLQRIRNFTVIYKLYNIMLA